MGIPPPKGFGGTGRNPLNIEPAHCPCTSKPSLATDGGKQEFIYDVQIKEPSSPHSTPRFPQGLWAGNSFCRLKWGVSRVQSAPMWVSGWSTVLTDEQQLYSENARMAIWAVFCRELEED